MKYPIPSNFSIEEMANSLPAVALDEEGSHSLPLRFSGSEAALLAVEEAEMNMAPLLHSRWSGFHRIQGRWDLVACMT